MVTFSSLPSSSTEPSREWKLNIPWLGNVYQRKTNSKEICKSSVPMGISSCRVQLQTNYLFYFQNNVCITSPKKNNLKST